jgi:hypothetical protein
MLANQAGRDALWKIAKNTCLDERSSRSGLVIAVLDSQDAVPHTFFVFFLVRFVFGEGGDAEESDAKGDGEEEVGVDHDGADIGVYSC